MISENNEIVSLYSYSASCIYVYKYVYTYVRQSVTDTLLVASKSYLQLFLWPAVAHICYIVLNSAAIQAVYYILRCNCNCQFSTRLRQVYDSIFYPRLTKSICSMGMLRKMTPVTQEWRKSGLVLKKTILSSEVHGLIAQQSGTQLSFHNGTRYNGKTHNSTYGNGLQPVNASVQTSACLFV